MCRYRKQLGGHGVAIASTRIDAERDGARLAAQGMEGQRDEVTTLADQMGTLSSAVGPDAWCGDSADAFRAHIDELGRNASGLAQGYDDIAVALRGHAQALDTLYAHVKDAEQRLEQGERDRKLAQADLETAGRAVDRAQNDLLTAQHQRSSAVPDPTGIAQVSARSALAVAQAARATAGKQVADAERELATAEGAIRTAEDDLDDSEKEHRRIGERCGDEILDARGRPFHTAAWEFVVTSIDSMGGNDWTDFLSGVAMMPAVAARQMLDKSDEVGSTLGALKAARREGSPAERAAARRAYTAALREVRGLRKDVGKLPWQPPAWLERLNFPLGNVSERLGKIPGVRAVPVASVVLAALSTGQDARELGLAHAASKNAASLGAGAGVAWGVTAGAAAVGVVGLAPVVAGVLVGGVVAAGVGYAVQEYGDDVAEAAGDAFNAAGDAVGGVKDGIAGLFS